MGNEENELLGFPEERRSAKSTFTKKKKNDKLYSDTAKKAVTPSRAEFQSEGTSKPMLYENDEGGLSAWNQGDTGISLHTPISEIVADGAPVDPTAPGAISQYNTANTVILRL